ncbi:MAG TPA: CaiB/BaiF CoA-transferase family protein [Actinomycetota bacterium]|nr:CaiB/BaiF CoA-transferase family protein [Actinomycetota bacterium]
MSRPLDGLRVLDLSRLLPGGYATLMLADLGADVVKVEEPGRGDYVRWTPPAAGEHSAAHVALNRNKRSLALDLKSPDGVALLRELVAGFDVVVESFRPGVMDRLGVGYGALRAANPALVYCAITGYGQDGPRAGVAGHDANYVGYAGVLSMTGPGDGTPVLPGVQIGDLGGGGMAAVVAVLAALARRARTGEGDFCDVSMTDGVVSWLSLHAAAYVATGSPPRAGRAPLNGGWPCYSVYRAADGHVTVAALEPRFWDALCAALGRPDLAGDAYATGARRDEVVAELDALFATRTRAQWMEALEGLDVCVAPVNDVAEALDDAQVRARGMVVEGDARGAGRWLHVGNPIRLASAPRDLVRLPPPALGEHTDEVLRAAGVDDDRIARLRGAGVVA